MTVETIVEPRHKRTHDQQGDAAIIQLGEEFADELRVTVDRVEHEGEAQTDDGAGEKRAEHDLLLQFDLDRGPHQEVDGDS